MTTPQTLPRMGDPGQPARSRVQLLQELKVARMEKVRLHRLQGREAATSRAQTKLGSPPGPAPAQPWYSTGPTPPRGASLDTNGVKRGAVIKGREVSCPRLAGAGLEAEKKASALPWMGRCPPIDKEGQIAPGRYLPPSTIQTDLARSPAAVGLARVLAPSEDPL